MLIQMNAEKAAPLSLVQGRDGIVHFPQLLSLSLGPAPKQVKMWELLLLKLPAAVVLMICCEGIYKWIWNHLLPRYRNQAVLLVVGE